MSLKSRFEEYRTKSAELSHLGTILSVLQWDQQTMAPPGGHPFRGKQMAALSRHLHRLATSKEVGALVGELHDAGPDAFQPYQWRSIEESKRGYDENTRVSEDLVARAAELSSIGQSAWEEAKKKADYEIFRPHLAEWIELRKTIARAIYPDRHPYDFYLDSFERGLSRERVDSIFGPLRSGLKELRAAIGSSSKVIRPFPEGVYPAEVQKKLSEEVAGRLGFSFTHGRLDESAHPFSVGIAPTDVRMTTRYEGGNFYSSMLSTVHEVGHSLYEQGLPGGDWEGLPVSGALGLVAHEGQSLLWERRVGQSEAFWAVFQPRLAELFPAIDGFSARELYEAANKVQPCKIRIDADELTYVMHILLRYELERDLFDDRVRVAELPEAWNERSRELLNIEPASDAEGVLQDSHWADGAFGYFPVYTLGAMYGSQLFDAARGQVESLNHDLTRGEYGSLLGWLREKVHGKGRLLDAFSLLEETTGKALEPGIYLDYLWEKYSAIYDLTRPSS